MSRLVLLVGEDYDLLCSRPGGLDELDELRLANAGGLGGKTASPCWHSERMKEQERSWGAGGWTRRGARSGLFLARIARGNVLTTASAVQ